MKGPSEEIYTANQRKEHNVESTLVHSVGYNAVADNTIIRLAIVASEICETQPNSPKIRP